MKRFSSFILYIKLTKQQIIGYFVIEYCVELNIFI